MSAAVTKKQPGLPPIDELRRRIGAEQVALDGLQEQAAELQEARKAALLADGDEPLAEVEASIQSTLRQAERHRARLDAALAELEVAEEEQRQEEALADYQRAAKQLAEAERWLMTDYPALAQQLADGLARLKAADQLAERVNVELPAGCERLRPPSNARHEPMTAGRRETRKVQRWIDPDGNVIGAIAFDERGRPNVHGARLVEVEEEVTVAGRRAWWPAPIYTEVQLPRVRRDEPDFWTS